LAGEAICSRPPPTSRTLTVFDSMVSTATDGTEFVLTTDDGRRLTSRELVGATLRIDDIVVRIDDVHLDSRAKTEIDAAWTPDGAVCVARPRMAALASLSDLVARYPRLATRTGAACTMARAVRDGAILFDRSR
jgi:hypothetical protein